MLCDTVMMLFNGRCIALWNLMKKKPLVCRKHHQPSNVGVSTDAAEEHWVSSVAAYPNTDLVASGKDSVPHTSHSEEVEECCTCSCLDVHKELRV